MLKTVEADAMIIAHRAWVSKFKSKLHGLSTEEINPAQAGDFISCGLGVMLASPQIETNINHQLIEKHKEFHSIAKVISEMIAQNVSKDDVEIYIDALDGLSIELIQEIRAVISD